MQTETTKATSTSLSPAQVQVVVALAAGQTVTAAARATGVSRGTIYSWLSKDAEFHSKYDIIRQNYEDELLDQILELRTLALRKLREILENPNASPAVKLRAALAVLKDTLSAPAKRKPGPASREPELDKTEQNPTPSSVPNPSAGSSHEPQLNKTEQNPTLFSVSNSATPRNALCPCGSGSKYKRCCGRHAPPVLNAA